MRRHEADGGRGGEGRGRAGSAFLRSISIVPKSVALVATLAVLIPVAGCTPWATYPPISGSVDVHNPELSPIPDVMAQALRFAHFDDARESELVFDLPPGTPPPVYDRVVELLGGGRPMTAWDPDAYHVTQVRVRTVEAEVDITRRNRHGDPQEMTVHVNRNLLTGFYVAEVRHWRYPVEMPAGNYALVTEPAPMETTSAWPEADAAPETLGAGDYEPFVQEPIDDRPDGQ